MDTKDGTTKLTFKYELPRTTAVYALTLYEQDVELIQTDGKYCSDHKLNTIKIM